MATKEELLPWIAVAEKELGVKEFPGDADNPRIITYHSATSYGSTEDETPWCSAFVNWCMKEVGVEGTHNAAARSWLHWGKALAQPEPGAITILWRGSPSGWQGHVGFYMGEHESNPNYIMLLGGNQGDSVCLAAYDKKRVLGFRLPS